MEPRRGRRRLVVNADDFGRSRSINEAVEQAHREGILTTASLMVGGEAFDDAVARARRLPDLGVGLHLTLACGRAVLMPREVPDLVDADGNFGDDPARSGFRYWARGELRSQLRAEIAAQMERFLGTGLPLDHVNGHLHFHLHPTVLGELLEAAGRWGIRWMRLTRDPWSTSWRLQRGRWIYRLSHAAVFGALCKRAGPRMDRAGIRYVDRVYGLLADGRVDADYLGRLLPELPDGDVEVFSHPSMDRFRHEYEALVSPRIRRLVGELGIELVRHQDL